MYKKLTKKEQKDPKTLEEDQYLKKLRKKLKKYK